MKTKQRMQIHSRAEMDREFKMFTCKHLGQDWKNTGRGWVAGWFGLICKRK